MIIGAGPLQAPAIRRAARMGVIVLATDMDENAVGFKWANGHALISTLDAPATVEYAVREKVDGVMTLATDIPLVTVAAVADALGLRAVSPEVAERATNKFVMKKAFAAAGVPCPRFALAATPARAVSAAERIGWPVVTKPLNGSGSRGVTLINGPEEMKPAFLAAREVAKRQQVVIEEFAEGRHLCVEAFTWKKQTKVLCVIDRIVSRPPHFVELRHTFPSSLPKKILKQVVEITVAGIEALGVEDGPSHTDMIVTERGPVISEIGARLDGDYKSSDFMPLVFGYDIIADTIRAALGETPLLFSRRSDLEPRRALCIRYFTPRPGVVDSIAGAAAAKKSPGVKYCEINIRAGNKIIEFTRSHDRVGVVIAEGAIRREAEANAAVAEKKLVIKYRR